MLLYRKCDYIINFTFEIKSSIKKTYKLSREQVTIVKKYINDILKKEYIKSNISKYATSVLIVKKLNDEFRICVNYRIFNAFIIKNRNALSLVKNILIKLCFAKYFNKFNIIATFNEIQMRESDKKKTTFLIKYNFFKYVIMFFKFCNISKIFQFFINVTLYKYLNDFCINYINNILIYSNIRKKHVTHVFKVLKKLQKTNFFLTLINANSLLMKLNI